MDTTMAATVDVEEEDLAIVINILFSKCTQSHSCIHHIIDHIIVRTTKDRTIDHMVTNLKVRAPFLSITHKNGVYFSDAI